MNEEPRHARNGTPMSQWMEEVANELPDDAVGIWQIVPDGTRGFGLTGEALTEYVRRQIFPVPKTIRDLLVGDDATFG